MNLDQRIGTGRSPLVAPGLTVYGTIILWHAACNSTPKGPLPAWGPIGQDRPSGWEYGPVFGIPYAFFKEKP